jgi:hypothetical protein
LVVFAIIAVLMGFLLPALHNARESARRTACQANLHQLAIAMKHFVEVRKKLPDLTKNGTMGGWTIAILPFMEDSMLADGLAGASLDPLSPPPLARNRPVIMSCPSAYEGDGASATVPVSHYFAYLIRAGADKLGWQIGELPTVSRISWVVSPEGPFDGPIGARTHGGGYNLIGGYGPRAYGVGFVRPD